MKSFWRLRCNDSPSDGTQGEEEGMASTED